jgi:murein DD-endopeptidase MepM/ murein hydrolase activator NlpD
LSNNNTVNLRYLILKGKGVFFGLYLLLAVNFLVSLGIGFMIANEKLDYWQLSEKEEEERLDSSTGYLYYDLPLPEWAKGFVMPITGTRIPNNRNLLPGAPRAYRNGRHEGVDLFCDYGTPVQAAKFGYVIFAGKRYEDTPRSYRKRLLELSKKLYQTPPEILEVLHGRRIILDHGVINERWVVTTYSHLSQIKEGLEVGDPVHQGDVIGYVGNSGTSKAETRHGAHLHFEIRVNGHYLGEGMSVSEAWRLLKAVLEKN